MVCSILGFTGSLNWIYSYPPIKTSPESIAILAVLLIGITSKYVVSDSNNEELTIVTTDFSSNQNEYIQCTFDDAIALLEDTNIVGYTYFEEPKRLDGYNKRPIIGAREPPGIEDDS